MFLQLHDRPDERHEEECDVEERDDLCAGGAVEDAAEVARFKCQLAHFGNGFPNLV